MNVHTCLVKRPPSTPLPRKVAGSLILQTACEHLQQCSCRSHRGLLEGMVGLLTTSAHARWLPSQQPAEERGERFTITRLTSPGLQTHSQCSGSAALSRKVTGLFETLFSKILIMKWKVNGNELSWIRFLRGILSII